MRTLILTLAAAALAATTAAAADAPTIVAKIKVARFAAPCASAGGGGAVWVSEYGQPYLLKINPRTDKVVKKIGIGTGSCGLGYGAGSLWIEDTNTSTVSRVDAKTGKRTAIRVGITPYDATFAYGSAWVTAFGQGELERIDPARNRVVKRWKLAGAVGVVGAFGSVWAAGGDGVIRVDPAGGKLLATIPVEGGAGWTAASSDAVWVTSAGGLVRIDPATNAVAAVVPLPQPAGYGDPDVVGGLVWVPLIKLNRIAVVDPATNAVVRTIKTGAGPFVVTKIGSDVWVPSWKGSDIWRFRP